jgi:hypothetical protein
MADKAVRAATRAELGLNGHGDAILKAVTCKWPLSSRFPQNKMVRSAGRRHGATRCASPVLRRLPFACPSPVLPAAVTASTSPARIPQRWPARRKHCKILYRPVVSIIHRPSRLFAGNSKCDTTPTVVESNASSTACCHIVASAIRWNHKSSSHFLSIT